MNDGKYRIGLVKISNNEAVPDDEPIFILRGRDSLAVKALKAYRELSVIDGCNDYQLEGIDTVIDKYEQFSRNNPEKMKQPGITRGF